MALFVPNRMLWRGGNEKKGGFSKWGFAREELHRCYDGYAFFVQFPVDQLFFDSRQIVNYFFRVKTDLQKNELWDIVVTRFSFQLAIIRILFNTFVNIGNILSLNHNTSEVCMLVSGKDRPLKK